MLRRFFWCLMWTVLTVSPATAQENATNTGPKLTDDVKRQIIDAIEDEIYDYKLESKFRSVGKALDKDEFQIPLFVTNDSKGSSYYVIYRLMPYGELYRLVTVGNDGLARLFRNPRSGFPPDAPAMQTLYYDDDQICQAKREATRLFFTVEMSPSSQRLREVIDRQKSRYGFSDLEEHRTKGKR